MTKRKPKSQHKKTGRPEKITPEIVAKLEYAFAIDATVAEACSYADISRDCFYDYIKRHPKFSDRIEDLRQKPILKARQTVVESLNEADNAKWYLERKKKLEFSSRQEIEHSQDPENPLFKPIQVVVKK